MTKMAHSRAHTSAKELTPQYCYYQTNTEYNIPSDTGMTCPHLTVIITVTDPDYHQNITVFPVNVP